MAQREAFEARARDPEGLHGADVGVLRGSSERGVEPSGEARREGSGRLAALVVAHWMSMLEGPFEWAVFPLVYFSFSEGFVRVAGGLRGEALQRVGWVCAMIASCRGGEFPELELRRDDRAPVGGPCGVGEGVMAWCCALRCETSGQQLRIGYRVCNGGQVRFDRLAVDG
jgi:hypothetical protein